MQVSRVPMSSRSQVARVFPPGWIWLALDLRLGWVGLLTLGNSDHPCARHGNRQCTPVRCLHGKERNGWRDGHPCSSGYEYIACARDGGKTNSLKRYSRCILLIPESRNTGCEVFSRVSLRKMLHGKIIATDTQHIYGPVRGFSSHRVSDTSVSPVWGVVRAAKSLLHRGL